MSPNITFETPPAGGMGLPAITPAQVALCHMVKGYLSPGDSDPGGTWVQRQALGDALLRAMRRSGIVEPTMEELIATLQVHRLLPGPALLPAAPPRPMLCPP